MKKIMFAKMVGSGNDFVAIDAWRLKGVNLPELAKRICDRKFGVGADGMLVIDKLKPSDVRMRIFNADGSEAEMCGNGARCTALWANAQGASHKAQVLKIRTKAGIIRANVSGGNVRIRLTEPKEMKEGLPIKVNGRLVHVDFINTGVPHAVIFVEGLEKIDVAALGREIRFHKAFSPRGTNVNFVEVLAGDSIRVRTYERGVEDETLACGTGSTASALMTSLKSGGSGVRRIHVETKSGEVLKVYFDRKGAGFSDVWLEGKAGVVFKGDFSV